MPRAGSLDCPIELQYDRNDGVNSKSGRPSSSWQPLDVQPGSPAEAALIWAEWRDVLPSRQEALTQGIVIGKQQARVRIRWRDDVTSAMRVIRRDGSDTVWNVIGGPSELGRREFLELLVERVI